MAIQFVDLPMRYNMYIYIYTIWFFNIANWKIPYLWRFIAGKIIYKWVIFHGYVSHNQRVHVLIGRNSIVENQKNTSSRT